MLASLFLIPSTESTPRQKIRLWDLETLQPVGEPLDAQAALGREAEFISFAFSPDGTILASGTDDGAIVLWDLTSP
jgi:WD40 repeat protein